MVFIGTHKTVDSMMQNDMLTLLLEREKQGKGGSATAPSHRCTGVSYNVLIPFSIEGIL